MTEIPPVPGAGSAKPWAPAREPLVKSSDTDDLAHALGQFRAGVWEEDQWTAFRLRYGVYGQRQPGVQMVRIKIPGGILSFGQARAAAAATREYAKGDLHVTTRQDFQIYYVATDDSPALLRDLAAGGLTTREACGNTLRNFSSCALAGICPREHVDAGRVAEQLSRAWLRHPLVQHMPRKFKTTVSGCATDCGSSGIHDLGLIATLKDGRQGFRVFAGGGTAGQPIAAAEVAEFVTEDALPAVVEALVRLHQRYSDRVNRNAARIKFLNKRFGAEKFRALFTEELERVRALPRRPWEKLAWRAPIDAPAPSSPGGIVRQHDGKASVVANLPLGLLSADALDALVDIAERAGAGHLRTTREQNLAIIGVPGGRAESVADEVRALGLPVEQKVGDVPDIVSCPGTTSCRIGITNSQGFSRELFDLARDYAVKPNLTIRASGCQNGCGLHHVADFGFRGMAKKIDGRPAPHYQIYVGGDARETGAIGLAGPIVPARHAREALKLLMEGYAKYRVGGESVREWALRLERKGLEEFLEPLGLDAAGQDDANFVDWGEEGSFAPPTVTKAECAIDFGTDDLFADLADDALITFDRALFAGARHAGARHAGARHAEVRQSALEAGRAGVLYAARRLVEHLGQATKDDDPAETIFAWVRQSYFDDRAVIGAFDSVEKAAAAASGDGDLETYREALALWIDTARAAAERLVEAERIDAGLLGDSGGAVAALTG